LATELYSGLIIGGFGMGKGRIKGVDLVPLKGRKALRKDLAVSSHESGSSNSSAGFW
jgi:hypothetical protein